MADGTTGPGVRYPGMAIFNISIVNRTFESRNEHELPTASAAQAEAIRGALQIGIDEIDKGNAVFGAEVSVSNGGEKLARYVVAIAVSPLK